MTFVVACGKISSCPLPLVDLFLTVETRSGRGQYEIIKILNRLLTSHKSRNRLKATQWGMARSAVCSSHGNPQIGMPVLELHSR